jgi:hypothetical protein
MRAFTAIPFLLFVCLATCEAQSTVPPRLTHQWQYIANLPPGAPILIRERYAPYPTPCTLAWIDNNSIACDSPDGRIIYPATSLVSVAPDTPSNHIPVGILVAAGAGAILGGLAGSNGTAGTTAAGAFIGAGLGAGTAAIASSGSAYPPQRGLRIPLRAHPFSRLPMRP